MSCVGIAIASGRPVIVPVPLPTIDDLRQTGHTTMTAALGGAFSTLRVPVTQFMGAALRPDGTAFYLTTAAPHAPLTGSITDWVGAFYAPFGICDVSGVVEAVAAGNDVVVTVDARLNRSGSDYVAAKWSVRGPAPSIRQANSTALIETITIINSGPHEAEDIRRCIALHARQVVWGEPQTVVAGQCGVAVGCLIEAIC
jgi:hypothetical protein